MWFPLNVGRNPHLLLSRLLKIRIPSGTILFRKWRNELNLLISSVWKYINYCVGIVYWNILEIDKFHSYHNLSLFFILFWCSFQSFGTPWLYKFSFCFHKSISVCSSPFRSFSVNCDTELTMSEKRLHTTNAHCHDANLEAKQGRPLCRFSIQYIQHTYSRPNLYRFV